MKNHPIKSSYKFLNFVKRSKVLNRKNVIVNTFKYNITSFLTLFSNFFPERKYFEMVQLVQKSNRKKIGNK